MHAVLHAVRPHMYGSQVAGLALLQVPMPSHVP